MGLMLLSCGNDVLHDKEWYRIGVWSPRERRHSDICIEHCLNCIAMIWQIEK